MIFYKLSVRFLEVFKGLGASGNTFRESRGPGAPGGAKPPKHFQDRQRIMAIPNAKTNPLTLVPLGQVSSSLTVQEVLKRSK